MHHAAIWLPLSVASEAAIGEQPLAGISVYGPTIIEYIMWLLIYDHIGGDGCRGSRWSRGPRRAPAIWIFWRWSAAPSRRRFAHNSCSPRSLRTRKGNNVQKGPIDDFWFPAAAMINIPMLKCCLDKTAVLLKKKKSAGRRLQDTATSDCHTTQKTYIHNTFYVIKLSGSSTFLLINLATVNGGGH